MYCNYAYTELSKNYINNKTIQKEKKVIKKTVQLQTKQEAI